MSKYCYHQKSNNNLKAVAPLLLAMRSKQTKTNIAHKSASQKLTDPSNTQKTNGFLGNKHIKTSVTNLV